MDDCSKIFSQFALYIVNFPLDKISILCDLSSRYYPEWSSRFTESFNVEIKTPKDTINYEAFKRHAYLIGFLFTYCSLTHLNASMDYLTINFLIFFYYLNLVPYDYRKIAQSSVNDTLIRKKFTEIAENAALYLSQHLNYLEPSDPRFVVLTDNIKRLKREFNDIKDNLPRNSSMTELMIEIDQLIYEFEEIPLGELPTLSVEYIDNLLIKLNSFEQQYRKLDRFTIPNTKALGLLSLIEEIKESFEAAKQKIMTEERERSLGIKITDIYGGNKRSKRKSIKIVKKRRRRKTSTKR